MSDKRMDWTICGRKIGTATGWDQHDTFIIGLSDFVAGPGYKGPSGMITFNFERGYIETYDDNGELVDQADLITAIQDCPEDRIE